MKYSTILFNFSILTPFFPFFISFFICKHFYIKFYPKTFDILLGLVFQFFFPIKFLFLVALLLYKFSIFLPDCICQPIIIIYSVFAWFHTESKSYWLLLHIFVLVLSFIHTHTHTHTHTHKVFKNIFFLRGTKNCKIIYCHLSVSILVRTS